MGENHRGTLNLGCRLWSISHHIERKALQSTTFLDFLNNSIFVLGAFVSTSPSRG